MDDDTALDLYAALTLAGAMAGIILLAGDVLGWWRSPSWCLLLLAVGLVAVDRWYAWRGTGGV